MYQANPTLRDRAAPIVGVALVHLALGYALLHLSGADVELARRADLAIFDVTVLPPPMRPPPPPPKAEAKVTAQKTPPKQAEGAASPKNIRSKPTPVVAPMPRIVVPARSPVIAAVTPGVGANASQGASDVRGAGTGAGGTGTGTGSGGAGSGGGGPGGAGKGQGEARARLLTPVLSRRDFPPALYREAPRGGVVFIILRVGPDGVPLSCRVARSFGDAVLDAETCRLAVARLRFDPGRDEQGRMVADYFGYAQDFNPRF